MNPHGSDRPHVHKGSASGHRPVAGNQANCSRNTVVPVAVALAPHDRPSRAYVLGSSPATVKKHLERVDVKLGVETRTAAAVATTRLRQLNLALSS